MKAAKETEFPWGGEDNKGNRETQVDMRPE